MRRTGWFLAGGLLVALLLAGVVSNFASSDPDGLDYAARKGCTFDADDNITGGTCMARSEREHELTDSPFAGYGIRGVGNGFLSTGLAGVGGVLLTFAVGGGVFWLLRRQRPAALAGAGASPAGGGDAPEPGAGTGTRTGDGPPPGASSTGGPAGADPTGAPAGAA